MAHNGFTWIIEGDVLWHSLNLTRPCSAKMGHRFTAER
jgi:hypothetical protein